MSSTPRRPHRRKEDHRACEGRRARCRTFEYGCSELACVRNQRPPFFLGFSLHRRRDDNATRARCEICFFPPHSNASLATYLPAAPNVASTSHLLWTDLASVPPSWEMIALLRS